MKTTGRIILLSMVGICVGIKHVRAQAENAVSSPTMVFVASTPCTAGTKPLPGIPKDAGCDLIKWELRLNGDTGKQPNGTYILDYTYGIPKQGTRGFINGGTHLHREGKWKIINGTKGNPKAIIYRLDDDKPSEAISFLRLNDNLLHLLDSSDQLMIGTGAWSYTLSRKQ